MQPPEIKLDQALNIIKTACAKIEADLATHNVIQQAIQVIEKELQPKTSTPDNK